MLVTFVVAYLLVTIAIGLLAARRVHGAKDYLVAGRSLPLYMNVATVLPPGLAQKRSCRSRPPSPATGWRVFRVTPLAPHSAWCWRPCCSRGSSTDSTS